MKSVHLDTLTIETPPGLADRETSASGPVTCLGFEQRIVVIGILVDLAALLVFKLPVLIVALGAVVDWLQEGRLVLLHHVGAGTAVGDKKDTCLREGQLCICIPSAVTKAGFHSHAVLVYVMCHITLFHSEPS